MSNMGDAFEYALSSNSAWAGYKSHQNPDFFSKLAQGQTPQILWIGCSDSRCPETTILGLQPGDVFVHRNIANIVSPTDINTSAVIEYAVRYLQVKHVVLSGHTSCGGALASLGEERVGGVLDTWLIPMKAIKAAHQEEFDLMADDKERAARMAELNVQAGIKVLLANHVIQDAMRERGLKVKGVMYDVASGRLRSLDIDTSKVAPDAPEGVVRGNHGMLVFSGANSSMKVS